MRAILLALVLAGCTKQEPIVITKSEIISAPQAFIDIPEPPKMPLRADRTNREMYLWRVRYQQWACDVVYRHSESVRYFSLGKQSVQIPQDCEQ